MTLAITAVGTIPKSLPLKVTAGIGFADEFDSNLDHFKLKSSICKIESPSHEAWAAVKGEAVHVRP